MDEKNIKELVEIALDEPIEMFDMKMNFYTDLGLDSMGALALFVELERRTRIEVDVTEAPLLDTGNALLVYILQKLEERNALLAKPLEMNGDH